MGRIYSLLAVFLALAALVAPTSAQTTWLGTTSSNWNDSSNWSNGVPTASTNATVNSALNAPTTAGVAATCRDLRVNTGASLDFAATSPLTVHGGVKMFGTATGTGLLRCAGNGSLGLNLSTPVPNVEVTGTSYTISGTVSGDLTQTATSSTLQVNVTVNGNAAFHGGTVTMFDGLRILNVAGDVTFQTTAPVTAIPGPISCGGNFTANANFQPASGRVVLDGSGTQTLTIPSFKFHRLEIGSSSSVSTALDVATNDDLTVKGQLTSTGTAITVGRNLNVSPTGSFIADSASVIAIARDMLLQGNASFAQGVFDVDGFTRFNGGSTTTFAAGTHMFSGALSQFGTLSYPAGVVFAFDGSGPILAPSGVPSVEIRSGDYSLGLQTRVNGDFDQLATAGTMTIGTDVDVSGNATIRGQRISMSSPLGFDVDGNITIATITASTDFTGILLVGGNWTSNANFQPANGRVIFDSGVSHAVTMPSFAWHALEVENGSTLSIAQDVTTTSDLVIRGSLTTTGTNITVGGNLSVGGSLIATSAVGVAVTGVSGVSGVADFGSATLDADGRVRIEGSGTLVVGAGPHALTGSLINFGTLTRPASTEIVFSGAGTIQTDSNSTVPSVTIRQGNYGIAAASRIAGSITQEATAGALAISLGVRITGDARFAGDTVALDGRLPVDIDGETKFQTLSASTGISGVIRVGGDWTSNTNFQPTSVSVDLDGAGPQQVTAQSLQLTNLTISASSQLTLLVSDLTVTNDLKIQGAFTTPTQSLVVGRQLTISPGGQLTVGPGDHRVAGLLRNDGGPVLGNGTIVLDGPGVIRATSPLGNLVVDTAGTREVIGNTTIAGNLSIENGSFHLRTGTTVVSGNAVFAGGQLSGGTGTVVDFDGNATFSGTTAGSNLPTIRCAGDWASNGSFAPASKSVILDGTGTTKISGLPPSFDPTFFDLKIRNGRREATNSFVFNSPTITVEQNATLSTNSNNLIFRCGGFTFLGTLEALAGDQMSWGTGSLVTITSTGTLHLDGLPGNEARFKGDAGGRYALTIQGTLEARHFEFSGMDGAGVVIDSGAVITALDSGRFADGAPTPNSVLLDVSRVAPIDFHDLEFDNATGAATFNVRSRTSSQIRILNYTGAFAGPTFEDDPNQVIDWVSPGRTEVSDFTSRGAIGRIELAFETTKEVGAAFFRVLRATSPTGPFTEITGSPLVPTGGPNTGATYALADSMVTFPTRYYYRLEEERQTAVRRLLATDNARPWPSQVNKSYFVGRGGFVDITAALQVAPAGSNLIVAAGTYPAFTVSKGVRIVPDGSGPVRIDTTLGKVVVRDIPSTDPDLSFYALEVGGLNAPNGIEVINCDNVIVFDSVEVTTTPGVPALVIDDCSRVAIQNGKHSGGPGLTVRNNARAYLSSGSIDVLDVRLTSTVVHAGVTPGQTTVDLGSTVSALSGTSPRLGFSSVWISGAPVTLTVSGNSGDLWGVLLSFGKSYVDLTQIVPVDMVLLLPFGSSLLTFQSGIVPVGGSIERTVTVIDVPALWGNELALQLVTLSLTTVTGRFGNVRDVVILP